jgi:glycosyltransferase involved in cell wall biosynthesis
MRIFYCVRSLEAIPSCMYNILMLQDAGYIVIPVIGRSTKKLNGIFQQRKLNYIDGTVEKFPNKYIDHFILTACYIKCIRQALREYEEDDLIIFGTADSAISVRWLYKDKKFILCLKELHENPWYYPVILKKLSKKAAGIICCEKNRARIIQFRWKLEKRPYVLSNKPYGYPTERYIEPSCKQTKEIIDIIKKKSVIVYQARHIHFAEELINLAQALKELNSDLMLVLIGHVDNEKDKMKIDSIYKNTLWTGHVRAPMHLEITSYAKIGVAVYAENSLNNLFCAPNKTYEYAGFGIPILCNDVPGLVETIGLSEAGLCVDWNNISSIKNSIDMILNNYDYYSKRALEFYASEDNVKVISSIVSEIVENNNG